MWSEIVQLNVIEDDLDILHFKYNYHSDNKRCKFKTTNKRNNISKEERSTHDMVKGINS